MLFVDAEENLRSAAGKPYGVLYGRMMSGVIGRLKEASVFVLDPTASAMAANVFFSRPSSILAALGFVRLPASLVWIEYSNIAVRDAFARLGNDNEWVDGSVLIERTGVLLTQHEGVIEMEAISQFRRSDGERVVELLATRCFFDTTPGMKAVKTAPVRIDHASTGQAKRYYDMLSRDEKESDAAAELKQRFRHELHSDFDGLIEQLGIAKVTKAAVGHAGDMRNMFMTQILPGLILMNCRNAVDQETVDAPVKLNKARRAKGKPEIGPYRLIKLKLSPKSRTRYRDSGKSDAQMAAGLVMGHFKTRKTGIYWWSPFYAHRGGITPAPRPVHVVTR